MIDRVSDKLQIDYETADKITTLGQSFCNILFLESKSRGFLFVPITGETPRKRKQLPKLVPESLNEMYIQIGKDALK